MNSCVKAAIVGVAGYTGQELAMIAARHPRIDLVGMFGSSRRNGEAIDQVAPALRGFVSGKVLAGDVATIISSDADVVFLATPHEASVALAATLVREGRRVVDLSAAYRLRDAAQYPAFYGFEHTETELLGSAVYGLPELTRADLAGVTLIAAPGCYPTSAVVPLVPLVEAGVLRERERVIIDSTSGVSGAGRRANERTSFCEVSQSPYGVFAHRHQPEIDAYAGTRTVFTPHLGPYDRGICSTIHVPLREGVTERGLRDILHARYGKETFVRLLEHEQWPSVGAVRYSNFIDIGLAVRDDHLIVVSCIDNLVKGAAGQAVQAFNASMEWDERLGLLAGGVA